VLHYNYFILFLFVQTPPLFLIGPQELCHIRPRWGYWGVAVGNRFAVNILFFLLKSSDDETIICSLIGNSQDT